MVTDTNILLCAQTLGCVSAGESCVCEDLPITISIFDTDPTSVCVED